MFRRKKRVYLVFEFVDKTVLDDLEMQPDGLDLASVKKISFQVLRGLEFCHNHNVSLVNYISYGILINIYYFDVLDLLCMGLTKLGFSLFSSIHLTPCSIVHIPHYFLCLLTYQATKVVRQCTIHNRIGHNSHRYIKR